MKRKRGAQLGTRRRAWKRRKTVSVTISRAVAFKESKFLDSDKDDAVVASGGAITTSVNLVAQNATESGRIGRKITITKIQLAISLSLPISQDDADIPSGDVCRVICYIDKQTNGADATVTDILETGEYDSFRNLANATRFQFLMDQTWPLNRQVAMTDGTNTSGGPNVVRNLVRKYFNVRIPIEFNSTTGAITEIRTNNVALLYITKNGLTALSNKVRIRYTG